MGLVFDLRRPGEHWLGKLELMAGEDVDEASCQAMGEMMLSCFPPYRDDLTELALTPAERSAMAVMVRAVNRVRGRLGIDAIRLTSARLHILPVTEYRTHFGLGDDQANVGHIYFPEYLRHSREKWALALSHEIAHLSSFVIMRAYMEPEDEEGEIRKDTGQVRAGLYRLGDDGSDEFVGLNEVVTDYVAVLMRRVVATTRGRLAGPCKATRDEIRSYLGQCELVFELCRQMAASPAFPWDDQKDVWSALLRDYWTGSDEFLDTLAEAAPDMHGFLRTLDDSREDGENALRLAKTKFI